MTAVNKNQIYVIHSFMVGMGLKQSELIIYAILYAFTGAEAGLFYGSQKYLSYLSGLSLRTVQRAIYSLLEKGWIMRARKEKYKGIRCRLASDILPSSAGVKCEDVKGEIGSNCKKEKDSVTSCVTSEKTEEINTLSKEKSASVNIEEFGILSGEKSPDVNIEGSTLRRGKEERGQALEIAARIAKSTSCADCRIASSQSPSFSDTASLSPSKAIYSSVSVSPTASLSHFTHSSPSMPPPRPHSITSEFLNYIGNSTRSVGRFVKYDVKGYGRYGFVGMTEAQYGSLLTLVDSEVLAAYVRRLEMMLEKNTRDGPPPPHSAYKTLKKWIEADYGV